MIVFEQFLKDNNITLKEFEANKNKPMKKINHPTDWIQYAFIWNETPQGHSYWLHLSKKWRQIVSNSNASQITYKLKNSQPQW
jgi:hypothetical protein